MPFPRVPAHSHMADTGSLLPVRPTAVTSVLGSVVGVCRASPGLLQRPYSWPWDKGEIGREIGQLCWVEVTEGHGLCAGELCELMPMIYNELDLSSAGV